MPKYLIKASYTTEGARGIRDQGGTARAKAVAELCESAGGKLESLHFAFGDADVYAVADLPDNESASSLALAVNSVGQVTLETVVLLTPEQVDAAAAKSVNYRPPGS
jgi:uncharacterized protein with GYD domain